MTDQILTPILPVNDMDKSREFYLRLGFTLYHANGDYTILGHPNGSALHLQKAVRVG